MEDIKNTSSSETDLIDSWTLLNHDGTEPVNSTADVEETSDSESLEVLEVEHADLLQSFIGGEQIKTEDNHHDETSSTNGSDYSNISDIPFHMATARKIRKYVHHPNPYINMWLSVVMVIAIAITLGLGIGHYLGIKRYVKVKDMIHLLRYENQILEQKLTEAIIKHKYCEHTLQEKVRYLNGKFQFCRFSKEFFSRYNYLQDNCDSWMNTAEENVWPPEENIANGSSFQEFILKQIPPMYSKCFDHLKSLECSDHRFGKTCPINETYIILKEMQGDPTIVGLSSPLPKVEYSSNEVQTRSLFPEVKPHLTFLHSFLSKWHEFIDEKVKIQSSTHKDSSFMQQHCNSVQPPNEYVQVNVHLNGNLNKYNVSNRDSVAISHNNNNCRSEFKQCSLQKDKYKFKYNTLKGKSLRNTEMSLIFVKSDTHQQNYFFAERRQQGYGVARNSQDSNISLIKKKHCNLEKWFFHNFVIPVCKLKVVTLPQLHKKVEKLSSIEGRKGNCKFRTCSYNKKQKHFKKSKHTSDCIRRGNCASKTSHLFKGKHDNLNNSNKEKNKYYKRKYIFTKPKRKVGKEKEGSSHFRTSVKKDTVRQFQNRKRKDVKRFDNMHKHYTTYNKELLKSKYVIRSSVNKKNKYFDKLSCTKNKQKKLCKQYNNEKSFHRFPVHKSKTIEDQSHHIYSKFGSPLAHIHGGKQDKGNKKNSKNNTFLQHAPKVHQGDKIKKYWKEKNKMYQLNIQNINIFKF